MIKVRNFIFVFGLESEFCTLEQFETSKKTLDLVEIVNCWALFERSGVALSVFFSSNRIFWDIQNLKTEILVSHNSASGFVQQVWVKLILEVRINRLNDSFAVPEFFLPTTELLCVGLWNMLQMIFGFVNFSNINTQLHLGQNSHSRCSERRKF